MHSYQTFCSCITTKLVLHVIFSSTLVLSSSTRGIVIFSLHYGVPVMTIEVQWVYTASTSPNNDITRTNR